MDSEREITIIGIFVPGKPSEAQREVAAKVEEGIRRDGKDVRTMSDQELGCRIAETKAKVIH